MENKKSIFTVVTLIIVFLLLSYHTYLGMMTRVEIYDSTSMQAIVKSIIDAFAVIFAMKATNRNGTKISRTFWYWIVWLFVLFVFFRLGGVGYSNYFQAIFPFCTYILFFHIFKEGNQYLKLCTVGFVILFLLSIGITLTYLNTFAGIVIGEDMFVSDLIFWTLTLTPFIFLVNNRILKLVLFGIAILMTIITAKRSVTITMSLALLVFAFQMTKDIKKGKKNIILFCIVAFVVFSIVSSRIQLVTEGLFDRFSTVREDQGSGRLTFYEETINALKNFDFFGLLLGHGYQSIHEIGHTNVHNDFLQMLYEYGAVGGIFYLTIFFSVFKRCAYLYKVKSFFFTGFFVTSANLLVQGLIDNIFIYTTFFPFLCAFWGITEGSILSGDNCDGLNN